MSNYAHAERVREIIKRERRIEVIDGSADSGTEFTWVGEWFKPELDVWYRVPELAANHSAFRGKVGICANIRSNKFGMYWAFLVTNEGIRGWVRTCYIERPSATV